MFEGANVVRIDDFIAKGADQLIAVYNLGIDNRTIRSTKANELSSRSHLIFSLRIELNPRNGGKPIVGKMTFIDLAGSERLARIGVSKDAYIEGLAINEGLLCLGNVIKNLSNGVPVNKIDYDMHLLTKAMKDSLGGNANTLMIVNISPSIYNIRQTKETLDFAKQTGKIQN